MPGSGCAGAVRTPRDKLLNPGWISTFCVPASHFQTFPHRKMCVWHLCFNRPITPQLINKQSFLPKNQRQPPPQNKKPFLPGVISQILERHKTWNALYKEAQRSVCTHKGAESDGNAALLGNSCFVPLQVLVQASRSCRNAPFLPTRAAFCILFPAVQL